MITHNDLQEHSLVQRSIAPFGIRCSIAAPASGKFPHDPERKSWFRKRTLPRVPFLHDRTRGRGLALKCFLVSVEVSGAERQQG